MPGTIYRFGHCEVDTAARELRVDGQPKPIEPRPFDVLVFLLQQRSRIVPTDELLDRLWRDEPVAPGSVVNAIAKVRRRIGDKGRPELIRTVHRVGYRFVADVVEALPARPPSAAAPAGPPALPLALLPFENLTGTPSLDWVSLGLMSLVCQALAADERLAPLPVSAVVGALRRADALQGAAAQDRARAVQRITGVRHVVHTRLRRRADDYVLDCRLSLPGGEVEGVLRASHPARLGRVLAHWLLAQLTPGRAAARSDDPGPDAWALEVLARALDAGARRQWEHAQALLAVVLDIEPDHPTATLELLQVRATLRETEGRFGAALDLWREAAERARAGGQQAAADRANGRAALAAAMCGLGDEALARAEDALAQAQARGTPVVVWQRAVLWWQVHGLVGQRRAGDPLAASHCADDAPDDARAAWWAACAHRLAYEGEAARAAEAFASAAALYRGIGAVGRESALLLPWLDALQRAGRADEAELLLQRVEAFAAGSGMLLRWLPWFRARQHDGRGDRAAACASLAVLLDGSVLDLAHAAAVALAARWLAEDGRAAEARATLARVGPGFESHPVLRAAASFAEPPGGVNSP